ncbi:S8 family peptidase [Streptomyces sp. NBC_00091]|uniref:S8 family peptidase n=1 Tax=Streptomyces sp. NBC_00091 TaxID=2975648 RepID=UPI00225AC41B|nr:S8 family peptidase [Streptomyces sp. NBC_00091]MCX5376104.1 S8 family peptidase [Streptomyces sp. NBC_00091]
MSVVRHTRRRIAGISATAVVALALGAAAALPASAADGGPQGVIENAGAAGSVPGSYIVTLKDSAARSTADSGKAVAKRYGAKIDRTYSAALNGYSVEVSEAQARKLAADPAVQSVVQNRIFTVDATQPSPPSWGLDRIDQRALPLDQSYTYPDKAGEGVTAYIIDTGVRKTHQDFGGRASDGYDAIDNDNTAQDGHGHGTHVAGTVAGGAYGVAKKAKIVGVRVLDNNGSGTTAQVVAGIDWVTRNAVKPAVANMSLGGGADSALDTAVRNSIAAGITYGVAAGNESTDASTKSPARVAEAITVGSTTNTDAKSSFSNYGSILDIFAPGSNITSAWGTGDTATNTISGTSMATPHVVGAAALYLSQNPASTPAQVRDGLVAAATPNVVTSPGTGSPNRLLNVGAGTTPPNPGTRFENTGDYAINDNATVDSPLTVSGISGNAPAALSVSVDIKHTYIGDLKVDLVAPDGTLYNLHNRTGGSADNIVKTVTVNASSEVANGVWKLRVNDNANIDTGKIDSWALQF